MIIIIIIIIINLETTGADDLTLWLSPSLAFGQ